MRIRCSGVLKRRFQACVTIVILVGKPPIVWLICTGIGMQFGMQLPLFIESYPVDTEALERCLRADVVAVDVETETRWAGRGPRNDFGLSYPADVIIIALAWLEDNQICTTSIITPFDESIPAFPYPAHKYNLSKSVGRNRPRANLLQ